MVSAIQLPLGIRRESPESLQDQIFYQIRKLILDGQLKPDTRIPPSRDLARQLRVSRNTAILACERLIAEGYLDTRPGVGTFVSDRIPEDSLRLQRNCTRTGSAFPMGSRQAVVFAGRPHEVFVPPEHRLPIDFKVGRPDPASFPRKTWRHLIAARLEAVGAELTEYNDPAGIPELRRAIQEHLGPSRGISVAQEQIIVVAGCQEALDIVARLFVAPQTRVVTECPCYQGAAHLFASYGAELVPVPVDARGLDTARLPAAPVALAYVTPSHQYPLGATLSLERRLRLLEWALETGAYLVEDDYDSDFRYDGSPLTALKGLDRCGNVIYLGTFSKSIGAGLRLGYMVVPEELVAPAVAVKTLLNNGQPWLDQAVVADFILNGDFASHLRRIRRSYLIRRDALVDALLEYFGPVDLSGLKGGMHLAWVPPEHFPPADELARLARARGVAIYTLASGAAYCGPLDSLARRLILLGYSSLTERQIREGIARIADAVTASGIRL